MQKQEKRTVYLILLEPTIRTRPRAFKYSKVSACAKTAFVIDHLARTRLSGRTKRVHTGNSRAHEKT